MSLPTLDQYREGCTTWTREYKDVSYTLSHHGVSDYSPQGTWCFYIHLLEGMFINSTDFALFDREPEIIEMLSGPAWETYDYGDVPDYGFHCGITYYDRTFYVDREGKRLKKLKIGCDYAHLWDREAGYPDGLDDVDRKAKVLIDKLVGRHPMKTRCKYSGKVDEPDNFYKAKNGFMVHKSHQEKIQLDGWDGWLPESQAAA